MSAQRQLFLTILGMSALSSAGLSALLFLTPLGDWLRMPDEVKALGPVVIHSLTAWFFLAHRSGDGRRLKFKVGWRGR